MVFNDSRCLLLGNGLKHHSGKRVVIFPRWSRVTYLTPLYLCSMTWLQPIIYLTWFLISPVLLTFSSAPSWDALPKQTRFGGMDYNVLGLPTAVPSLPVTLSFEYPTLADYNVTVTSCLAQLQSMSYISISWRIHPLASWRPPKKKGSRLLCHICQCDFICCGGGLNIGRRQSAYTAFFTIVTAFI